MPPPADLSGNHARATAAAARRADLGCVLPLAGTAPGRATGDLLLDELLGARLERAGDVALAGLDAAAEDVCARLRAQRSRPSRVPYGGSDALGVLGHVEAAAEISAQVPDVAHVVTAVGSGGTTAGLVTGLGSERVLGVDVGYGLPTAASSAALEAARTEGVVLGPPSTP